MSDKEIRRTKTDDPEMDAIMVLNKALTPLDRAAAKRVLTWAEKRYVDPYEPGDIEGSKAVQKFMDALTTVARDLSIEPPRKILDAMSLVVTEMREQKQLESVEVQA